MFGYLGLYCVLFIPIKSNIKSAHKIINKLINEHIFHFPGNLIETRCMIYGGNHFILKDTMHIQNPSVYLFHLDLVHLID